MHSSLLMIAFVVVGFTELILHYSTIEMNIIRWVLSRHMITTAACHQHPAVLSSHLALIRSS
jgi:hypothetical protein